jgi:ribonuclease Y
MVNNIYLFALALTVSFVIGFVISIIYSRATSGKKVRDSENKAEKFLHEARREAEAIRKEAELSAKDKIFQAKSEAEKELKERRVEVNQLEKRLRHREEILDRKLEQSDRREQNFNKRDKELNRREKIFNEKDLQVDKLLKQQNETLERISGISREEARKEFLRNVEEDAKFEAARVAKRMEDEAVETADRKAKGIISVAIQRYASDYVSDNTISAVSLPTDEMKGRIIGREGRNIRALEAITGVELIIDDTPENVILSSFDPVRREIARISLERLIADGRIHPARIEEVVEKVKREIEATIREEGDKAVFELGLHGIHPELIKLIGRLRYRTSYAQNVLQHSKEVAYLTGIMSGEIGVDIKLAKRAGILHDIGKAVDHETEGSHQFIGANIAKKYGENSKIVNAIEVHHGEGEPSTIEGALVAAADALSAARPGARKESLDCNIL